jgi:prepilin-type N-terminal cleavage/methylation domain-containing protein
MFIMNKRSRETEGLTLIELLVTIAVIAIVAAISVPVISNVVGSARTNAAGAMEE